ncbi:hypothetical protein EJ08DRAFT_730770 [Tothia fuscella]|uniref:Uncharacterized protein n=1 Tax=Tothia fuscella TaxID=1048955 RepID=A0A9P4U287_9PEZI|nr:hypothetical protein EJ08DRAFT_730770 [Tothia fuscella]
MARCALLTTFIAASHLALATGPIPSPTPASANGKIQARAPAPTPAPSPDKLAKVGTRLVPGVVCNNQNFNQGPPAFQSYLSAHRGQQQICPNDARIRYLPDDQQIGCCTNSATLTQVGGQYGCCLCGSQCQGGVPPMGDWFYDQNQQLIITQALPQGAVPGYTPVYSCIPGQPCNNQPGGGGGPIITDPTNGGVYALGFVPTSQTVIGCGQAQGCQTIYYGPNTATTIFPGGGGNFPGNQGGICNTVFANGVPQTSCTPGGAYGGGIGGAIGNQPCYTFFNGNQQSISCAGMQLASTYYTTSTQSICQTFNGQQSCSLQYITMATRTSFRNAAARETGAAGVMGQLAAGMVVFGAGLIL